MPTTDNYKRVEFHDGEGVTYGDLEDAQTFMETRIFDQILHNLIGNTKLTGVDPEFGGMNGADAPTHLAYCLSAGSAFLRTGSASNKLQIAPGVLLQKTASSDGNTPKLLAYTFAGTEEVTIAAGDPTHPRIDLIQMKLELVDADSQTRDFQDGTTHVVTSNSMNKKKRVQCTLSVKSSAAVATPQYPDPDAGYVAVAGIVVNTNWLTATGFLFDSDSTGAQAYVHDQRMPVNVQGYVSDPSSWKLRTAYSLSTEGFFANASNATNKIYIPCPKGGCTGRIVGISGQLRDINADGIKLYSVDGSESLWPQNTVNPGAAVGAGPLYVAYPYYTIEATGLETYAPAITASATNKIGSPLWTNGTRVGYPPNGSTHNAYGKTVYTQVISGIITTQIGCFVYYIAQGI